MDDYAWFDVKRRVVEALKYGPLSTYHETRGMVREAYILSAISKDHKESALEVLNMAIKGGENTRQQALEKIKSLGWEKEEEDV